MVSQAYVLFLMWGFNAHNNKTNIRWSEQVVFMELMHVEPLNVVCF